MPDDKKHLVPEDRRGKDFAIHIEALLIFLVLLGAYINALRQVM